MSQKGADEVPAPPPPPTPSGLEDDDEVEIEEIVGMAQVVPPARHAPRGLAGMLDDREPYALMDTSAFPRNMVLLHIYDVGDMEFIQDVNRISTMNDSVLLGGVYHAGVEVYGKEWCYGFTAEDRTGVGWNAPRCNAQHTYKATVKMGVTQLSEVAVERLLEKMSAKAMWQGPAYDFLKHNCLDFASKLCKKLGVKEMPGWIDRFGRIGRNGQAFAIEAREIGAELASDIGGAFRDISTGLANLFAGPAPSQKLKSKKSGLQRQGSRVKEQKPPKGKSRADAADKSNAASSTAKELPATKLETDSKGASGSEVEQGS